jgi:hypothetical protein
MGLLMHPVTAELWRGIQYTAPRVLKAWQESINPMPVTPDDVAKAQQETAMPSFDTTTEKTEENHHDGDIERTC